jgi:hypothetical protein
MKRCNANDDDDDEDDDRFAAVASSTTIPQRIQICHVNMLVYPKNTPLHPLQPKMLNLHVHNMTAVANHYHHLPRICSTRGVVATETHSNNKASIGIHAPMTIITTTMIEAIRCMSWAIMMMMMMKMMMKKKTTQDQCLRTSTKRSVSHIECVSSTTVSSSHTSMLEESS